ncbi:MAG: tyrosine-type recombinase/integrase [Rhizobiales bacterium]|nr:tyrosine-type recombinase/integrase [Hyphomicrobiales bacterium]
MESGQGIAMRVVLPGIHKVRAAGKDYYYAWRGGPRLHGEPGSPEFVSSYESAHRLRKEPDSSLFHSVIARYKASPAFTKRRERTRADYHKQIAKIEIAFGDLPMAALEDPRITREFLDWRDKMANSPRQADYAWTVLMRIISWAREGGETSYRPPERIERLYKADRAEMVWNEGDIAAFMAVASMPLQIALSMAIYTGQRQADLLAAAWTNYDGRFLTLRQLKTGRRVEIPVHKTLKAILDGLPRQSLTILTNGRDRPWAGNAFRKAWGGATRKAGIQELTFHDLRGTAVTRLAEAECTPPEIAAITGHSMRDVGAILERYMARTQKLAVAAITKLEKSGQ